VIAEHQVPTQILGQTHKINKVLIVNAHRCSS